MSAQHAEHRLVPARERTTGHLWVEGTAIVAMVRATRKDEPVLLRNRLSVRGTRIGQGDTAHFDAGGIVVSVTQTTYEHSDRPLLLLEAVVERDVPDEVRTWLLATIEAEALEPPPDDIYDYLLPLVEELHDTAVRAFGLLRWRTGSDTPHSPFASLGNHFSVDGGATWNQYAMRGSVVGWHDHGLPLSERTESQVNDLLVDPDLHEPIGHVLLREADDSRTTNPRSAVVIGVAALETAIKSTIADLVPGSEWLVGNLPSPPLAKLLKDYLPTLPVRNTFGGIVHPPTKEARRLIFEAVEQRNRVAHRGELSMGLEEIIAFLAAAQNTLYLLDYYRGQDWALDMIDRGYRAELGT